MPAPRKYPAELRDRALRLVREDGEHGAIARVADGLDSNRETLRTWVETERHRTDEPDVNGHRALPGGEHRISPSLLPRSIGEDSS